MANVTINDEHLVAIGEALRGKLGETKTVPVTLQKPLPLLWYTPSATGHDSLGSYVTYSSEKYVSCTIPGASSIKVKCTSDLSSSTSSIDAVAGVVSSFTYGTALDSSYNIGSSATKEVTFTGDSITIKLYYTLKCYIEIFGLDADGNEMAYYETEGEGEAPNTFKPRDMATAIDSIESGLRYVLRSKAEAISTTSYRYDLSDVIDYPFVAFFAYGQNKVAHAFKWDPSTQKITTFAAMNTPIGRSSATSTLAAGTFDSLAKDIVIKFYSTSYPMGNLIIFY